MAENTDYGTWQRKRTTEDEREGLGKMTEKRDREDGRESRQYRLRMVKNVNNPTGLAACNTIGSQTFLMSMTSIFFSFSYFTYFSFKTRRKCLKISM